MATNHESQTGGDEAVDPLSHLALLVRSKAAPEYEEFLNFGPRWYTPLYATLIGGMSLWGAELLDSVDDATPRQFNGEAAVFVAETQIGFLLLALASCAVLTVHWFLNRQIQTKPSVVSALLTLVAVVVVLAVWTGWGVVIAAVGYEDFLLPWAPVAWVLTTGFFLTVRAGLHRIRDDRRVAAV